MILFRFLYLPQITTLSVLDAHISKSIQGTCLIFSMELTFLEHLLFMCETVPLGLFPGWGQRSLSRKGLMLKYFVKVYFDYSEVLALHLVGTFP